MDAVFAAPTTEVFTAFGAEPGCLDTVREFVAKVLADRPEGCLGAMAGRVEEEISKQGGIAEEKGPAVVMMIGWEGVEEHMKAKGREDGGKLPFLLSSTLPGLRLTDLLGSTLGQHPPVTGAEEGGRDVSRKSRGAVRYSWVNMERRNCSSMSKPHCLRLWTHPPDHHYGFSLIIFGQSNGLSDFRFVRRR